MAQSPAALLLDIDPETGLPDPFSGAEDESFETTSVDDTSWYDDWFADPDSPVGGGIDSEWWAELVQVPEGAPDEVVYDDVTGLPMEEGLTPFAYDSEVQLELAQTLEAFGGTLEPALTNAQQQLTAAFGQPAITEGGKYVGIDPLNGNLVYANADGTPIATVGVQNQDGTYSFTSQGTQLMNATYPQDGGAGVLGSINNALKAVSGMLSTPLGKLAGGALIGGLGLGAQALFGGSVKQAQPAQAPNTATVNELLATGQGQTVAGMKDAAATPSQGLAGAISQGLQGQSALGSLANLQAQQQFAVQQQQQPVEQGIAMNALNTVPGLMNATTNQNIMGTAQVGQLANTAAAGLIPQGGSIAGGIGQQIQNVLAGNYSNPILENNIKMRQQEFQQRMQAQLGPDWQNTTTGMQAAQQQALLEESLRFQDQQQTIANYTPLFNASTGLQTQTGTGATNQVQQAQGQGLAQAVNVAQMGKQNVGQITSSLASVAPTTPLSGVQSAAQAAQQNLTNQQQASLANAATTNAANQSLAAGIGSLGGVLAGGLFRNPQQQGEAAVG